MDLLRELADMGGDSDYNDGLEGWFNWSIDQEANNTGVLTLTFEGLDHVKTAECWELRKIGE